MIRVAVLGAGHWGPNLIRSFHTRQASEVTWVVDLDAERAAQVSARYPDVRVSARVQDALGDPAVDAVVICTPTTTHYDLARSALAAGKHVLVEKPITTRSDQAEELCRLAEAQQRVLLVGHIFLYNAAVRYVKRTLDAGELGRVYYIAMERTNLGPIRIDVNAAWDLAAHDVAIVDHWLGGSARSVSATGGTWINAGIEDAVFATLRYADGVLVNLHASWLNPKKARQITVVGDRRMLTVDDMNLSEPVRIYDKQVTDAQTKPGFVDTFASFRASVRDGDITIPRVSSGEPLKAECDHFLECIANGKPPLTDGRSGARVVRTLEAITRSMQNHGREEPV
jgi:predicted dehydrogenase